MKLVATDRAPAALGPYSQAVCVGDWIFTAGQIGLDPGTGSLVGPGTEEQTRQVLANLRAVLATAGAGFTDVVKATIYLVDLSDFEAVNALYEAVLDGHRPARSTVEVAALPKGARVEIDLVAHLGDGPLPS